MYGNTPAAVMNTGDLFPQMPGDAGTDVSGSDAEMFQHPLDSEENVRILRRVHEWWTEARDAHADNRREQMTDADYYDCLQWQADDAAELINRGQAPLTFPLIKQMCDWTIGTERKTRIDWDVLPRQDSDVKIANVKKDVLKWISDINGAGWERSKQFADVVKVGEGWTEECYSDNKGEEGLTIRYQDWKGLWRDPYSRSNTLRDCRYLHRAKWLDLDYAISMFPDRANELSAKAVDTLDPMLEQMELEASLPMMFYGSQNPLRGSTTMGIYGVSGTASITRKARRRVLMVETWFKRAVNTPLLLGDSADDLNGTAFNPQDPIHRQAVASGGTLNLVDSVTQQMWCAIWTPGLLIRINKSPYKHGRYPFTPAWAYRRHRDGMAYGIVRPARDSQDEYNKRRGKILFELNTSMVLYEQGAMDEVDEDRNLEELRRPDGEVRLNKGGLEMVKVIKGTDTMEGQIKMLAESKENVYESSGVTRENTGTSTGDQSGRAILAKQQQGSVTTAELFDNYRQAIQESGQKMLSNAEQFITLPKLVRIAGPDGAMAWVGINQPQVDPATGQVKWANDITDSEADFIVDETDFRETVRMAMAESMFELIGRLPPTMAMALLDMAVDLTDIPNKQAMVNRIRTLNGQMAPGQEDSPEGLAQQQAAAAAKQAAQQQQSDQANAETALTQNRAKLAASQAGLADVKAQHVAVQGKQDAMATAATVHAAPSLAPAADKLWNPAVALPDEPNQYAPHV
jgi:hypothetical protein